jgi:hypothetical protein
MFEGTIEDVIPVFTYGVLELRANLRVVNVAGNYC